MKEARIKFTWGKQGPAHTPWHLGLFAIHRRSTKGVPDFAYLSERVQRLYQKKTVFISVRGLLVWTCALAAAAYFSGAFAILQIQRRQPHCQITYADLVLPTRWAGLDELRGAALLEQARDEFNAGRFMSGFNLLRSGLARKPGDTRARLDLSTLYVQLRLRAQSDRLLLAAFDQGYPGAAFLSEAYAKLAEGDNPGLLDTFLQKARDTFAAAGGPPADARLIEELSLNAALRAGRQEEAGRLAARLYPENSDQRLRKEIQIALAAGDTARAVALAEVWERLRPSDQEVVAMVAGVYRKAGRHEDMQAAIRRLRALNPSHAGHATFGVVQNHLAGRTVQAREALEDWFFRFGSDDRSLAQLSRDLSKVGADDLLARVEEVVREHGFDPQSVLVGRLFAQIDARDWERAVVTRDRLAEILPRMKPADRLAITVATTLVTACVDAGSGNQEIFIEAFLRSPGSLEFNRRMLEALVACGRLDTAAQLVTLVEGSYPESQYVARISADVTARRLAQVQAEEAARPAARQPGAPAYTGADALWADLKELESAGKPDEALRRIRAVRAAAPKWLPAAEEALLLREIDLALQADDMPLLQLTLRNGLRLRPESAGGVLERAVRWREEKRTTEALLVAREILRRRPDFQPALQAVAAWDPKPPVSGVEPEAEAATGRP